MLRTVMMSPLVHTSRDKRFLIIPVDTDTSLSLQTTGDNQTKLLASQIRDKVSQSPHFPSQTFNIYQIAKQKLLQTAKILCNVLDEPVRTYVR